MIIQNKNGAVKVKPTKYPPHHTVTCHELGCSVDEDVANLVWAFSRFCGVHTISSCQGYPPPICKMGYVAFTVEGGTANLYQFCCYCLRPALQSLNGGQLPRDGKLFLDVDVIKEVAWLRFDHELIPQITKTMLGLVNSGGRGAY